jgi:nickel-dependent lactate racemase
MATTAGARLLTPADVEERLADGLAHLPLDGRRVLVLIPDRTRTMPMPLFYRLLVKLLSGRARRLRFLVALGTHPPLDEEAMAQLLGASAEDRRRDHPDVEVLNHAWDDPAALATLGEIPPDEIERLSGGLFRQGVAVRLNREVLENDVVLVCGPVFPHEVAGFSGGNKYLFPGIAGARTSPRKSTSSGGHGRCDACWPRCPRCTASFGWARRACTRASPWSPTAARW